jgi:hypothetical protein
LSRLGGLRGKLKHHGNIIVHFFFLNRVTLANITTRVTVVPHRSLSDWHTTASKMLAIDAPQPAHKKLSLLRRFSRRPKNVQGTTDSTVYNHAMYNDIVRSPPRLRTQLPAASLPTPPLSPTSSTSSSKHDSVLNLRRSPSPHLTKDKSYRKDRTITYTQRIDIPQIVRERLSRETSSKSSSPPTLRVPSDAIPTTPFPSSPHGRVRVSKWDVYLPPAQIHALYLGHLPYEMSDKWFIYSEGPDAMGKLKVHFHRSWTGTKIAELFVVMDVKGEGAGKVVGIKWVGGEGVGGGKLDGKEAKYLIQMTVRSVLGFELEDGD